MSMLLRSLLIESLNTRIIILLFYLISSIFPSQEKKKKIGEISHIFTLDSAMQFTKVIPCR